jgi:hypothetical protein
MTIKSAKVVIFFFDEGIAMESTSEPGELTAQLISNGF